VTREEFDRLPSDRAHACPDCGERTTHPTPGCGCPSKSNAHASWTEHINAYHHTCPRSHDFYLYANISACRRCGVSIYDATGQRRFCQ